VQDATDSLFQPPEEVGQLRIESFVPRSRVFLNNVFVGLTPMLSERLRPGRHRVTVEAEGHFPWSSTIEVPPRDTLEIHLGASNLPPRRSWPSYVAWGGATTAVLGAGAGTSLKVLASGAPGGHNRAEAMMNFERQRTLSRAGTGVLIGSALLAAVSIYHFVRYRSDILGQREPEHGP
jgi:hypothetical protein